MTIETSWFTMDNKLGIDLNRIYTSVTATANPSQPEYPGIPHTLGDRVQGNNGSEWVFVQASATVTAYNALAIDTNFKVAALTSTLISSGTYTYGFAQFKPRGGVTAGNASGGVANAGDFFWALVKVNHQARLNVTASVSVAGGAALYISPALPGFLTTSATASRLNGIVIPVSASGGGDITITEFGMFTYLTPAVNVSVLSV
jgi:hypothetical protein